jgi:hypothetical protein
MDWSVINDREALRRIYEFYECKRLEVFHKQEAHFESSK